MSEPMIWMIRRFLNSLEAVTLLLIWMPAIAAFAGVAAGWIDLAGGVAILGSTNGSSASSVDGSSALSGSGAGSSGWAIVTLSGIASVLASWIWLGFMSRRRSMVSREMRKGLRASWEALDRKPPTSLFPIAVSSVSRDGLANRLVGSSEAGSRRSGSSRANDADEIDLDDPETDPALSWVRTLPNAIRDQSRASAMDQANIRAVLDAVESAVFCTDSAGRVMVANTAGERFFANRSVVGARIEELFTQAEILGLHANAAAGRNATVQIRMNRAEGARVCQAMAYRVPWQRAALRDDEAARPERGREAIVIVIRDVTELAMAVQLKAEFVANASHELRTPLASIRGAVETIQDGAKDEPAMLDRLSQMIAQNVSRLEDLVRDLLDLSRLESPDIVVTREAIRLEIIVEQLQEMFMPVCVERKIAIAADIDPACAVITSDAKLLTLILKNLFDNATKYAYPETAVRVVARPIQPAAPGGRPGVRISVVDLGMGIPIGHQQRVFERFYQVDPSRSGVAVRRGTGLGLAIVKHATKTLGGNIRVESVWKQGTTMIVELPFALGEVPVMDDE